MPRGPLPDPHAQRRNAATIPVTSLPAAGRDGDIPDPPSWCSLGQHGRDWWVWAWVTPESAGWSSSLIDVVAQRASLVDDLNALERVENLDALDAGDLLAAEDLADVRCLLGRLAALATGRLAVLKVMAMLDVQLGFGAKNLAALRWTIQGKAEPAQTGSATPPSSKRRLSVVSESA